MWTLTFERIGARPKHIYWYRYPYGMISWAILYTYKLVWRQNKVHLIVCLFVCLLFSVLFVFVRHFYYRGHCVCLHLSWLCSSWRIILISRFLWRSQYSFNIEVNHTWKVKSKLKRRKYIKGRFFFCKICVFWFDFG